MFKLDNNAIFGTSPSYIKVHGWTRETLTKSFPGVDGEVIIDLGKRSRKLIQIGRLRSSNATGISNMISNIQNKIDAKTHTLIDDHGISYTKVLVESFELKSPIKKGVSCFCDYEITYRQLA